MTTHSIDRARLLDLLIAYYDVPELDHLMFTINIRTDAIGGETITERARKLVEYCERRGQLEDLLKKAAENRKNADWSVARIETTTIIVDADNYRGSIIEIKSQQNVPSALPIEIPPGHTYKDTGRQPGSHVLIRNQDNQIVLYLPRGGEASYPFLIDKTLITNAQYAAFLNSDDVRAHTDTALETGRRVVITREGGQLLVGDAETYWNSQPARHFRWGISCYSGHWEPMSDSSALPVTLVTALGASWYAAWVTGELSVQLGSLQSGFGLPSEGEWATAALWDYTIERARTFPWGNDWNTRLLNSASYWAEQEFLSAHDKNYVQWLKTASRSQEPRPTPVGQFGDLSPSSLTDAYGNVWEWLAARSQDGGQAIRGGACTSPRDKLHVINFRQPTTGSPYVGFRCCFKAR